MDRVGPYGRHQLTPDLARSTFLYLSAPRAVSEISSPGTRSCEISVDPFPCPHNPLKSLGFATNFGSVGGAATPYSSSTWEPFPLNILKPPFLKKAPPETRCEPSLAILASRTSSKSPTCRSSFCQPRRCIGLGSPPSSSQLTTLPSLSLTSIS